MTAIAAPRRAVREREFAELTGIARATLRNWRSLGRVVPGVTWTRIGDRIICYDLETWEKHLSQRASVSNERPPE